MSDEGPATVFSATAEELGNQLREARVDHAAFARPMRICELSRCRATCCHDGVVIGEEEARVIGEVLEEFGEDLTAYGWQGEEWLEDEGDRRRTATRPAHPGELAEDFPAHFPRTRCVFLDAEHRCVLQRLATDQGKHPWFWKPVSCWMQPLRLVARPGERPCLTIPGPEDDPLRRPGYPGFSSCTPCGREQPGGQPAAEVLRAELEMLGVLGGRNLVRELG